MPMCHRQLSIKISQNPEYIFNFCNDNRNIPFHFACWKWYLDSQNINIDI